MTARRQNGRTGAIVAALVISWSVPVGAQSDPGLATLEREIARLAELAKGRVGVGIIHLETGRQVYLNPDEPFPMASTFKFPVAVQLLTRVQKGELKLDSMIALRPRDLHPGSGTLTELFDDPGVILSLRNVLELSLLISDNSAADITLDMAGGPAAVTQRIRALGADGIRVDRPTVGLIADWLGVTRLPPVDSLTPAVFSQLAQAVPDSLHAAAEQRFNADPRDTATPRAMAALLVKVWKGEALNAEYTALLLDIMRRCTTGPERIKGMLAPGTEVAHKTGTIGQTTNDVGIVTLPDSTAGHVVTVVFVKESKLEVPERERTIAQIARAVHDYFLFNPRPRR